ncbi:MAG: theronine dehydrogenase [Rhodospirillaceae bacterium TMED8]|nr:theronine dehydrogenase [Magnetovibrio sp.]OUT50474.1 MAG: theronine dehydrogenase [Rhodospirillaceae bacterium TMED8]|tara:strand:- start:2483 stop:4648 length:2166 start_codon:yes stop_codon:yes gene_type:complete
MKQVIQSRKSGKLALKNVPEPKVKPGHLLVETRASLISAGTERLIIDFAKKSLAGKARARPDLMKKVISKAKRDGLKATMETVMARLDEPLPLGYSAAGVVKVVGAGLEGRFRVGQRVAMAGAALANHAELNVVPENLISAIPDGVEDEEAAFGTLGAIAMHAVRNAQVSLGDIIVIIGCGLVGQLTAQLVSLAGGRAVVLDYNLARLKLVKSLGAEYAIDAAKESASEIVREMTDGRGADAIIIAAATTSNKPLESAADLARDRARVVLVGMTGTEFSYANFMKKELNIIISRSYGPGRYDSDFERRQVKYPEGWVRWTETQNLAETLRLMSPKLSDRLNVGPLISHRFPLDKAIRAYDLVTGKDPHLGVVLTYSGIRQVPRTQSILTPSVTHPSQPCRLGVIGGGNYARSVILPTLQACKGVILDTLVTEHGTSAEHGQAQFGFVSSTTDPDKVFSTKGINAVIIATRHSSHAALTVASLKAGKSVWVEKPLALDWKGLNAVIDARNNIAKGPRSFFQIGFNRRFAPAVTRLIEGLSLKAGRRVIFMRINAGAVPADHWVHSADEGGGRILGEACHFIDLARALAGSPILQVDAHVAGNADGAPDNVAISLEFTNGSLATLLYTALGDNSEGKELIEVHSGGATYTINDFRSLSISGEQTTKAWRGAQDKGAKHALGEFIAAVNSGAAAPINEAELIETSAAALAVMESLRSGTSVILT